MVLLLLKLKGLTRDNRASHNEPGLHFAQVKRILTKLQRCWPTCRKTLHRPPQSSYKKPKPELQTPSNVRYNNDVKFFQGNSNSTPKTLQQHHFLSFPFPSVLSPNPFSSSTLSFSSSTLSFFTDSIVAQKPFLDSLLLKTGAILFRGFDVNTAKDFNDVVEAFGFEELPYVGGAAPRTNVVCCVFTANESPPDQKIPFHHEMAQVPEFPSKLFFFCEVEPGSGGETPIVLSHVVYERMKERHSDFVEKLEEHGLIYTRVLGEEDDPSSPIGRGWKSTFLTNDKSVAAQRAAKLGMTLEWLEDGVKTIMGPVPAIKYDKSRNRKIWFNSMVAAYTGWKDARNDPIKAVKFGDGEPLPSDIIHDCLEILEEESLAIPWQKGDVLLIDNWAVLHARRSFNPPRRILASLCK